MAGDRFFSVLMMICEAESEGRTAMEWCLWTAYNRTKDHRYRGNLSSVICQRMQFSEFNDDKMDNLNLLRVLEMDEGNSVWQNAYEIYDNWQKEIEFNSVDPTQGSTHFYAEGITPPGWSGPPAVFRGQQGKVRFYSNVR